MKKTITLLAALLLLTTFPACHRGSAKNDKGTVTTQTIAPAPAKPDQTGSGDAMTQTVDVDDSRSDADGGVTAPSAPAATAPAKPAKKKHR